MGDSSPEGISLRPSRRLAVVSPADIIALKNVPLYRSSVSKH